MSDKLLRNSLMYFLNSEVLQTCSHLSSIKVSSTVIVASNSNFVTSRYFVCKSENFLSNVGSKKLKEKVKDNSFLAESYFCCISVSWVENSRNSVWPWEINVCEFCIGEISIRELMWNNGGVALPTLQANMFSDWICFYRLNFETSPVSESYLQTNVE